MTMMSCSYQVTVNFKLLFCCESIIANEAAEQRREAGKVAVL